MQAVVTGSRVPTPSQYPCGCTLKAPPLANLEQGYNIPPPTAYTDFSDDGKEITFQGAHWSFISPCVLLPTLTVPSAHSKQADQGHRGGAGLKSTVSDPPA